MPKARLEAFSDGVIAILITIMVLELKTPHGPALADLGPVLPTLYSYVLSFLYLGIYWNNHHHLLQAASRVSGAILWANLHVLFWLSLIPFATTWIDEHRAPWPTACYGIVLLMAASAYQLLQAAIVRMEGPGSALAKALGQDWKGKASLVCYLAAVGCSFVSLWIPNVLYFIVAVLWIIPDRRLEHLRRA